MRLDWRRKFGVLGPSTNTIVQPDFDAMRPPGVTNHYSRIFTPNANAVSNESFRAGAEVIASNTLDAVRSVMTCSPDYLVMGMSAVTFFDGEKGADRFTREVEETAGIKISIGSDACTAAMRAYGGVKRIAILSPYWPAMNTEVARYFADKGFTRRARQVPAMPVLDPDRRADHRDLARRADRARRRRRRRDRAGRHQPVDGAARGCRGNVARQADHRDQHRHLLACVARQRHQGSHGRLRPAAGGILTHRAMARPDARYGSATVSRIVDLDPFALPLGFLFPGATLEALAHCQDRWPARMSIGRTARSCSPFKAI